MQRLINNRKTIIRKLRSIQKNALGKGIEKNLLKQYSLIFRYNHEINTKGTKQTLIVIVFICFIVSVIGVGVINSILSERCLLPSSFVVWEATRPLANCSYCENITKPIILRNVGREDFKKYAYTSHPIVIKNAISHWRATKEFSFKMFKRLYEQTTGSYESLDEGCQFLNFKTDLFSLKEVFNMPDSRVYNEPGESPWYVGWGNCHPEILTKVRKYYKIPEFLPEDAEFPATENIFFGYEMGAVMHLDYIPRLMWQGQVKGNKIWSIAPVPECEHICYKFEYYVEPGDIVLLDTRVWYHATRIPKGQFSLTVQSEYG